MNGIQCNNVTYNRKKVEAEYPKLGQIAKMQYTYAQAEMVNPSP